MLLNKDEIGVGRKLKHKIKGNCTFTYECFRLETTNPGKSSLFVDIKGEIEEVSLSLLKYKRNKIKKAKKHPTYFVLEEFRPDEILPHVCTEEEGNIVLFHGVPVKMWSQRYQLFAKKGVECVCCGLKGSIFSLETFYRDKDKGKFHFNLYGIYEDRERVMLTKDLIVPKSKGGKDHIDNYQVLCTKCNIAKGKRKND